MIRKLAALSVLLFAFAGTAQAASQTVTFNSDGSDFFHFTDQEHTINWVPIPAYHASYPDYAISGLKSMAELLSVDWVAANRYLYSVATFYTSSDLNAPYAGELFDLNTLWLASGYGSQTLVITGYDANGTQIYYRDDIRIDTEAKGYQLDWKGISAFYIDTHTIDDFVKNPNMSADNTLQFWVLGGVTVTVVPEPETWAMLLAGLGVVGAVSRRRRASAAM